MVLPIVRKIEAMLSEAAALQKTYVTEICPRCASPCCTRVHYLFSEKDLIFLRLSGRSPRWRRDVFRKKGCWFLGEDGCTLDPEERPFICLRHICSRLETEMERRDPGLLRVLEERFRAIGQMQSQLWAEYLDAERESRSPPSGG